MSLHKLAGFVILIWLPLASLNLHDQNPFGRTFPNKKTFISEKNETHFVENITKAVEENSFKGKDVKPKHFIATGNFPKKMSANYYVGYELIVKCNERGVHKLTGSVKKDLSALKVNNRLEKISALISKKYIRRKRKKINRKMWKREVVTKITAEDDLLEDYEEDDAEESAESEEKNTTEMGSYVGAPCEQKCSEKLLHVICDPKNKVCECEEKYPVQIDIKTGCEKPKQLGDQCFYAETCSFFDPNAICMQINHNAICQCKPGYHSVGLRKGVKRMFCSEDIAVMSTDLPTLLGVATGIAVLTGLICFVLKLFSGNRYPNARHYANANVAPPLLLSSDNQWVNGIPLTVHGRPSSRSSCQRSTTSLTQYNRSKGVMVPASRAGAARAAAILLIPCHLQASRHSDTEVVNNSNKDDADVQPNEIEQTSHFGSRRHSFSSVQSTSSSQKSMSYSARRFEQENQLREQRAAMKSAREEAAKLATPLTPSPISTEGLILPSRSTEEDPLCSHKEELPAQSEPPALVISQGNTPEKTSSK